MMTLKETADNPLSVVFIFLSVFPGRFDEMKHQRNTLLLWLLLFIVTACQPNEQNLPIETISQGDGFYTSQGYSQEEPALLVIVNPDEVDKPGFDVQFPLELADQLRHLDYNHYFAILVFQGLKHQGGYSVTIQKVTREDDQVYVHAEFISPEPGSRRIQAFTSPYHLISVSKESTWDDQFNFLLIVDDKPAVEATHMIP
jgi:hypothetical protein